MFFLFVHFSKSKFDNQNGLIMCIIDSVSVIVISE